MGDENRKFPRVLNSTQLRWRPAPAETAFEEGMQLNISGGGVCFYAPREIGLGEILAIELDMPSFPVGVLALGRVVWCRVATQPGTSGYDIGVEFHWVGWDSAKAQQSIADYVKGLLD